jgi:hypothetical protein
VTFSPPSSDGGDTITLYKVEYATSSNFANPMAVNVTYLEGGAPFFRTLSGLTKGVYYFVRVYAYNSQGFGKPTASTPTSLNPYTQSGAPSNIRLRVTSNTMVTVGWEPPLDDGGDTVTSYRVEWDVTSSFNGIVSYPNKVRF